MVSWQAPSGLTTRAQDAPNVPFYVVLKEVELRMAERVPALEERISSQVQRAFSCPKMQICLTISVDLAEANSAVATPQLAIPSGAVDLPEGGIMWHDARIVTQTRDGINAPSLLTLRQLALVPAATVTPPAFIDVICLDYDLWDSYATYGLESPVNRFRARKIGKDIAQPPRKRGAPRGPRSPPLCTTTGCLVDGCSTNCDAFYGKYVVQFMSPARGMTRWFVHRFMYTYPKEGGNCADLRPKTNVKIWNYNSR
jgi:hypothetical protein